jgi:hypothetical protein
MLQGEAHKVAATFRLFVDEVIVNRETPLLHDRAHLREPGVLVPSAALVEIREGKKARDEEEEFSALHAGHGERRMTNA